jgi:hypothetical protein
MGNLQKIFYGFLAGLSFKFAWDLINQGCWLLAFVACFFIAIFAIAFFEDDEKEDSMGGVIAWSLIRQP